MSIIGYDGQTYSSKYTNDLYQKIPDEDLSMINKQARKNVVAMQPQIQTWVQEYCCCISDCCQISEEKVNDEKRRLLIERNKILSKIDPPQQTQERSFCILL